MAETMRPHEIMFASIQEFARGMTERSGLTEVAEMHYYLNEQRIINKDPIGEFDRIEVHYPGREAVSIEYKDGQFSVCDGKEIVHKGPALALSGVAPVQESDTSAEQTTADLLLGKVLTAQQGSGAETT